MPRNTRIRQTWNSPARPAAMASSVTPIGRCISVAPPYDSCPTCVGVCSSRSPRLNHVFVIGRKPIAISLLHAASLAGMCRSNPRTGRERSTGRPGCLDVPAVVDRWLRTLEPIEPGDEHPVRDFADALGRPRAPSGTVGSAGRSISIDRSAIRVSMAVEVAADVITRSGGRASSPDVGALPGILARCRCVLDGVGVRSSGSPRSLSPLWSWSASGWRPHQLPKAPRRAPLPGGIDHDRSIGSAEVARPYRSTLSWRACWARRTSPTLPAPPVPSRAATSLSTTQRSTPAEASAWSPRPGRAHAMPGRSPWSTSGCRCRRRSGRRVSRGRGADPVRGIDVRPCPARHRAGHRRGHPGVRAGYPGRSRAGRVAGVPVPRRARRGQGVRRRIPV